MVHYQLIIKARYRLETLERIFRVIRHRGGHVNSMNMNELDNGERVCIDLILSSTRPIELFFTQLNKLIDIDDVEVVKCV